MVEAYWLIGKRIVEEEQKGEARAEYGKRVIKALAQVLAQELGAGFNETNLKYFRQFYLAFRSYEKSHTVCDESFPELPCELSWSHYRLLMRVENVNARDYYMQEAATCNWSVRQLQRNINILYYERLLTTTDKQYALQQAQLMEKAKTTDFIKDPYVLEFLGLPMPPSFSEVEFEAAIVANLQQFLLELGKGFSLSFFPQFVVVLPQPPLRRHKNLLKLIVVERLLLYECSGDGVEFMQVFTQDAAHPLVRFIHNASYF